MHKLISTRRPKAAAFIAVLALVAITLLVVVAGCGGEEARENRSLDVGDSIQAPFRPGLELAISGVVAGSPPRRDLVIVDADGASPREIATGASPNEAGLAWSPDGERVAFAGTTGRSKNRAEDFSDIFIVNLDGGKTRRLTSTGRAFAPVWSPDGQSIVFAELDHDRADAPTASLWAIDADGGKKRALLKGAKQGFDVASSFSPDGSQLALTRWTLKVSDENGMVEERAAIYLLDTRSLELRKLADRAAEPAFSPDGAKIAYVSDRDENGELSYGDQVHAAHELYVMDADGGGPRRLTNTRDLNERVPAWSPDGSLIAYQRGEEIDNAEGTVVLTIRPDGSCPRRIAADPGLGVEYGSPAWRPARLRGGARLDCAPE